MVIGEAMSPAALTQSPSDNCQKWFWTLGGTESQAEAEEAPQTGERKSQRERDSQSHST